MKKNYNIIIVNFFIFKKIEKLKLIRYYFIYMSLYRPNSMPVLQRRNSAEKNIFNADDELYNEGIKYLSNFSYDGFNTLSYNCTRLFASRNIDNLNFILQNLKNRFNRRIYTREVFENFSREDFEAIYTKLEILSCCLVKIKLSATTVIFSPSIFQSIGISQKQDKTKSSRTIRNRRPKSPRTMRYERKQVKRKRQQDRQLNREVPPLSPTKIQKTN